MIDTPLDPAWRHVAGTASYLLIGLAAACGGLLIGITVGRRLRGRKTLLAEFPYTAQSDEPHPDSQTDGLTGLANHSAFDAELLRQIDEFQRRQAPFCLLMLDVDHFKEFNDIHDHLAGDDVLRMVARKLKATVREADLVARYGGEEFGIMMPHTTLTDAMESAQRVRVGIEQAMCEFGGRKLKVTVSIGVAEIAAGLTPAVLMRCADEALYSAKQAGRNQVQYYCAPPAAKLTDKTIAAANGRDSSAPIATPAETKPSRHRPAASLPLMPAAETRTDSQTGLPNRTAFREEIHRRLSEAQRHGNRLSLMLIRIDNLAKLIYKLSPPEVDLVVRTCAQFFSAAMRDMDLVVRYDTDVFGIMLPGTALVNATGVGHRLRTTIEQCPLRLKDAEIHFTLSAGVAESQPGEDLASFLKRAEETKTAAIAGGGNCVRFHNGIAVEAIAEKEAAVV
jgi:diguanylate cyclase